MRPFLDMVNEVPRGEKEHKGDEKYKSKCLRLNNNHITELTDMWAIVDQIIAQPNSISWIDLSFNELTKINPVSKAFSQTASSMPLQDSFVHWALNLFILWHQSQLVANNGPSQLWAYLRGFPEFNSARNESVPIIKPKNIPKINGNPKIQESPIHYLAIFLQPVFLLSVSSVHMSTF